MGDNDKKKKTLKIIGVSAAAIVVAVGCFFGGYFTYASKLDSGLRSLLWVKDTIQREYEYEVTDEAFYAAALNGVNDILDPYSEYMSADEYAQSLDSAAGNRTGIGLQFSVTDADGNSRLLISRVTGNSPAYRAGIREGHFVTGCGDNEADIVDVTVYAELTAFLETKSVDEAFYLRLKKSEDGSEYTAKVQKTYFAENYVTYRSADTAYVFSGNTATTLTASGDVLSFLQADTAYIRLTQFNGNAASQFGQAMSVFKQEGKKNLILDLRGNGGGFMSILEKIASYFCKNGQGGNPVIATAEYGNGMKTDFKASENSYYDYFSAESKICVLADDSTASASECLIGCMVDYGALKTENVYLCERVVQKEENGVLTTTVEAKTYGKGIMQTTFTRNAVSKKTEAIKLTTARILWPVSGKCIHGIGVTEEDGAKRVAEKYFADGEIRDAFFDFLADN